MKNVFDFIPPWIAAVLTVWVGIGIFYAVGYYKHQSQPVAVQVQPASPQNAADTFTKKEECSNLKTSVTQEVNRYNLSQHVQSSPGGTTFSAGDYLNHEQLYQIFYSSTLDTCVKVIISQSLLKTTSGYTVYEESYDLYDALTGQYKDYVDTVKHGSPYGDLNSVDKKLAQYQ